MYEWGTCFNWWNQNCVKNFFEYSNRMPSIFWLLQLADPGPLFWPRSWITIREYFTLLNLCITLLITTRLETWPNIWKEKSGDFFCCFRHLKTNIAFEKFSNINENSLLEIIRFFNQKSVWITIQLPSLIKRH